MPLLPARPENWTVRPERVDAGRIAWVEASASHFALLADLHLSADASVEYDGFRPLDNCARVVEQAFAEGVEGVLVAGDLAWANGEAGDYDRIAAMLTPLSERAPVVLAPGNHDRRDRLLRRFHPEAYSLNEPAKLITVIDTLQARLIMLDSLYRTDVVPGLLGQAQRHWLANTLDAEPDRPTLLFVHHPLGEDDGALLDAPRLLSIVEPRRQVKAIFTAHDHVWRLGREGACTWSRCPPSGFLSCRPSRSAGWRSSSGTVPSNCASALPWESRIIPSDGAPERISGSFGRCAPLK
ncbi:MAG: metallophosphoesterase [Bryobacterales bacterium]